MSNLLKLLFAISVPALCVIQSYAQSAKQQSNKQVPTLACDLQKLNQEYVAQLSRIRKQLLPTAPAVRYDSHLLYPTVLHNMKLEKADSLFHDLYCRSAELVGTKYGEKSNDPVTLVRFIIGQLQSSEGHCVVQSNPEYLYVAVCATANFYVVRLSRTPTDLNRSDYKQYLLVH